MNKEINLHLKLSRGVVGLLVLAACAMLGMGATAVLAQSDQTINGCISKKDGTLRVVKKTKECTKQETPISWNETGPRGKQGPPGPDGGDAGTLDGLDSKDFATSTSVADLEARAGQLESDVDSLGEVEPWREVGATGEPQFQNQWTNLGDSRTATAAFYKDPWGIVHLKGTVKNSSTSYSTVFTLPCGYGPNKDQNFAVPSPGANSSNLGIVDVVFESCGGESYRAAVYVSQGSATAVSLNGITFQAHGS